MANYAVPPSTNAQLIEELKMQKHPEGGYFVETDRQEAQIPTPFVDSEPRSLATSIYYLLTHEDNSGVFHMNKSITYHVHHLGRAEYTLITPGSPPIIAKKVIGPDASKGETRMLLVGTGVWKMSRILPEDVNAAKTADEKAKTGCLITEVVTPGFHWEDHAFLTLDGLKDLFRGVKDGQEKIAELTPFLKKT